MIFPNTTDAVLLRVWAEIDENGDRRSSVERHLITGWRVREDGFALPVCPTLGASDIDRLCGFNVSATEADFAALYSASTGLMCEYGVAAAEIFECDSIEAASAEAKSWAFGAMQWRAEAVTLREAKLL